MRNKWKKALALGVTAALVGANIFTTNAAVINKSETVYRVKEGDDITEQVVSVWLNSDDPIKGKDKTDLKEIRDLKTDEAIGEQGGYINWQGEARDIYYQGQSDKEIPVEVKVEYDLDGRKMTNQELAGQSGHLRIVLSAENKNFSQQNIGGRQTKVYAPYVVVSAMNFNDDIASEVKAPDSKVVKDGKNEVVTTLLLPGMRENFKNILSEDKLADLKSQAVIEMEIKDYEPIEAYVLISNEFFQNEANLKSVDDLKEGIASLVDNGRLLVEASSKLAAAQKQLGEGIDELSDGTDGLKAGTQLLSDKSGLLADKAGEAIGQLEQIPGYAGELAQGGAGLAAGLDPYTKGVDQLAANTGKLEEGAEALAGSTQKLASGLGQLKEGTGKLRAGTAQLSELGNAQAAMLEQGRALKDGTAALAAGAQQVKGGVDRAAGAVQQLADGNAAFNQQLQGLNDQVQAVTLPDVSGLTGLDVSGQLTTIGNGAQALGGNVADLQQAIGSLSALAESLQANGQPEEAGAVQAVIQSLGTTAQSVGQTGQSIGEAAQQAGEQLAPLSGLSDNLAQLGTLEQLKPGMQQLAEAGGRINENLQQAPGQMTELKQGATQLLWGASFLDSAVETGLEALKKQVDPEALARLGTAAADLDEAAVQLQAGSDRLSAGAKQNRAGAQTLAAALVELDRYSADLNGGAKRLSAGLQEFEAKSQQLGQISQLQDQGIVPLRAGIAEFNQGADKLSAGAGQLKEGSRQLSEGSGEFAEKMAEYKEKGLDQLDEKTSWLPETKDVLDKMLDLAQEDASFSGSGKGFKAQYRIIEKIK